MKAVNVVSPACGLRAQYAVDFAQEACVLQLDFNGHPLLIQKQHSELFLCPNSSLRRIAKHFLAVLDEALSREHLVQLTAISKSDQTEIGDTEIQTHHYLLPEVSKALSLQLQPLMQLAAELYQVALTAFLVPSRLRIDAETNDFNDLSKCPLPSLEVIFAVRQLQLFRPTQPTAELLKLYEATPALQSALQAGLVPDTQTLDKLLSTKTTAAARAL